MILSLFIMVMIILFNVAIFFLAFYTFGVAVAVALRFTVFILPSFIANQPHFYTAPTPILRFYDVLAATTVQFRHRGIVKYEMIIIND